MAVPKKRTSMSKRHLRRNYWKRKRYKATVKAFYLDKSVSTDIQEVFLYNNQQKQIKQHTCKFPMPRYIQKAFSYHKGN
ncbi:hypothetical protein AMTRI_Chr11g95300 [Amborella trichopoda]